MPSECLESLESWGNRMPCFVSGKNQRVERKRNSQAVGISSPGSGVGGDPNSGLLCRSSVVLIRGL